MSTKSSVIGKAWYNYGALLLFFHAQTLIWLFFVKIILFSICKWGNKLWAKLGKSHLASGEEKAVARSLFSEVPSDPSPLIHPAGLSAFRSLQSSGVVGEAK